MRSHFVLLLLLLFATLAQAGHYETTYEGGECRGRPWDADTEPYEELGNGWYGTPYTDYYESEGVIKATLAWKPDYAGEKPPQVVVIAESCIAWGYPCDNGFGDPLVVNRRGGDWWNPIVHFSIKQNPGSSFPIYLSPWGRDDEDIESAGVYYRAEAAPPAVNLSGGIRDSVLDRRYLIGQQLTGTVSLPFGLTPTTHAWSVGGGEPFGNWSADRNASHYTPTFPTNQAQVACHFKKAEPDGTVSVSVTAATPPGSTPNSLSLTITAKYDVLRPDIAEMVVKTRPSAGGDALNSWTYGSTAYAFPTNGVGIYPDGLSYHGVSAPGYDANLGVGIRWDGKAYTYVIDDIADHNPWGGQGDWHFVQTVVPNRSGATSSGTKGMPENGQLGLDSTYPYEPGPFDPAPGSPGAWPCDGGVKTAADAPGQPLWSGYTSFSTNDAFKTWMMYRPPGSGSVFVPVKKISWHWQGGASLSGGVWTLGATDAGYGFDGGDYPPFPTWSRLIQGGGPSTWVP